MVSIEIADETLRASLAAFLDANFGGSSFDRDGALDLDFRSPGLSAEYELRLTERLLHAWHAREHPTPEIDLLLTASSSATFAGTQPVTIHRRLQL